MVRDARRSGPQKCKSVSQRPGATGALFHSSRTACPGRGRTERDVAISGPLTGHARIAADEVGLRVRRSDDPRTLIGTWKRDRKIDVGPRARDRVERVGRGEVPAET